MNTELLQTFLKIVEYRQFSLAANSLYISQAAVSNRLNKLESYLGVKLINRSKGKTLISLTIYGEKLVPIAKNWVSLVNQAENLSELVKFDTLSIRTNVDISNFIITPFFNNLKEKKSSLRLSVDCEDDKLVPFDIYNKNAEIGISFFNIPNKGLTNKLLIKDQLIVLTNSSFNLPNVISTKMLSRKNEIYVNYSEKFELWHSLCWNNNQVPLFVSNNISTCIPTLLKKQNWVLVPKLLLNSLLRNYKESDFTVHTLLEQTPYLPIYVYYHTDSENWEVIHSFINQLKVFLANFSVL